MILNSNFSFLNSKLMTFLLILLFTVIIGTPASGADSELTRQTIKGLEGVNVIVEDIQPNIQKYAQKAGITKEQIQKDVETKLRLNRIKILTKNEWLKTPGKPSLYVNINTHETEKYLYAYDVRLELKQIVSLEANPSIKAFASTWSINLTGMANIGTLAVIKNALDGLLGRFIDASK